MNVLTSITVIACVAIVSFAGLVFADKINLGSNDVQKLESQLQQANARLDILYGKAPQPVETNNIILPLQTSDYIQNCNIRQNCVEPYILTAYVGDTITWTNNDTNQHNIEHTSNFAQSKCGAYDSSMYLMPAPHQSSSMKFDKAGEYDYCVSGYDADATHGVIIIKEKSGLT